MLILALFQMVVVDRYVSATVMEDTTVAVERAMSCLKMD